MVTSVADLIENRGGPAAFARAIGCDPGRVRAWKFRDYIPRTAWPEIVEVFPDVTIGDLKELERGSQPAPDPTPQHRGAA